MHDFIHMTVNGGSTAIPVSDNEEVAENDNTSGSLPNRPAVPAENKKECVPSNLFVDVTGEENKLAAGTLQ